MKILFVNTNIGYGGASKMMVAVANKLVEKNDVTFLTFRDAKVLQPLNDSVKHIHSSFTKINVKGISNIIQIIKLHKFIKDEKYDLAVAFLHPAHYMLTIAAKGTKTKVLLSERADPTQRKNHNILFKLLYWILNQADAYVFQTEQAKLFYSENAQKKSVVIPNPIPDKKIPNVYVGERKKKIVNVARLEMIQKRQDVLIEAFARISNKIPEYELLFYGDGPDEDKIKTLAENSGVGDKIKFMGVSRTVLEDIRDSALFVLSSDYEGIPNALLEAMAIGLPCISTDCSPGGARVLINSGENGVIIPCGNAKALADGMLTVISDEEFSEKISKNAINVINIFDKKKILDRWIDFIESKVVQ